MSTGNRHFCLHFRTKKRILLEKMSVISHPLRVRIPVKWKERRAKFISDNDKCVETIHPTPKLNKAWRRHSPSDRTCQSIVRKSCDLKDRVGSSPTRSTNSHKNNINVIVKWIALKIEICCLLFGLGLYVYEYVFKKNFI